MKSPRRFVPEPPTQRPQNLDQLGTQLRRSRCASREDLDGNATRSGLEVHDTIDAGDRASSRSRSGWWRARQACCKKTGLPARTAALSRPTTYIDDAVTHGDTMATRCPYLRIAAQSGQQTPERHLLIPVVAAHVRGGAARCGRGGRRSQHVRRWERSRTPKAGRAPAAPSTSTCSVRCTWFTVAGPRVVEVASRTAQLPVCRPVSLLLPRNR